MTRQVFELHSFTVEGGLQLEKDVRTIGAGFAELTPDRIPAYKGDVRCQSRLSLPPSCYTTASSCRSLLDLIIAVMIRSAQSVRSKLSRLGNIASIVAISSVEDLEDYDLLLSPTEPIASNIAGGTAKKLSQAEAVKLLKVRSSQLVAHPIISWSLRLCSPCLTTGVVAIGRAAETCRLSESRTREAYVDKVWLPSLRYPWLRLLRRPIDHWAHRAQSTQSTRGEQWTRSILHSLLLVGLLPLRLSARGTEQGNSLCKQESSSLFKQHGITLDPGTQLINALWTSNQTLVRTSRSI